MTLLALSENLTKALKPAVEIRGLVKSWSLMEGTLFQVSGSKIQSYSILLSLA